MLILAPKSKNKRATLNLLDSRSSILATCPYKRLKDSGIELSVPIIPCTA